MIATSCVHSSALRAAVSIDAACGGATPSRDLRLRSPSGSDLGLHGCCDAGREEIRLNPYRAPKLVKDALKGMLSRPIRIQTHGSREYQQMDVVTIAANSAASCRSSRSKPRFGGHRAYRRHTADDDGVERVTAFSRSMRSRSPG